MVWENHAFPQNIEVYNVSIKGKSPFKDVMYEKNMKQTKSVISLWKETNNVLMKEKEVQLPGNYNYDLSSIQ